MDIAHTVVDSPVGPLTLRSADGVLDGLFFGPGHRHGPSDEELGEQRPDGLPAVREQLDAYFDGTLTSFEVDVSLRGTEFQQRVWSALRDIPFGTTCSYGELAAAIGAPSASRAVGLANGKNPVSIVVPCHRVVGADGSLTGYGGGTERKRALLDLERRRSELALFR